MCPKVPTHDTNIDPARNYVGVAPHTRRTPSRYVIRQAGGRHACFSRLNGRQTDPSLGRQIKNLPETITVSADASASDIFEEISKASRFSIHRLRVTKGSDGSPINNVKDVTVHDTGLRNKSAVDVKDLGMQYTRSLQAHS